MKKIYVITLNIGYWIFLILLITFLYSASQIAVNNGPSAYKISLIVGGYILVPSLISFYGSYFLLFRHFVQKATNSTLIVYGLSLLVISTLVGLLNINSILGTPRIFFEAGFMSFLFNGFNALIGFILHSFISWFTDLKVKEELNQKNKMLELEMIKLKLDPHFLFNTINNIDVLIETDAAKASEYVIKLSSILRFYLYKSSDNYIKLSEELEYIQEYIDLQKIRTTNEDFVKLYIEGNPENKEIAPMIFISFIENAFKHSKNKKIDSIDIKISIHDKEIVFQCKNTIDGYSKNKENGIGNDLIESRLTLIYGVKYELDVDVTDQEYTVILKIPV